MHRKPTVGTHGRHPRAHPGAIFWAHRVNQQRQGGRGRIQNKYEKIDRVVRGRWHDIYAFLGTPSFSSSFGHTFQQDPARATKVFTSRAFPGRGGTGREKGES